MPLSHQLEHGPVAVTVVPIYHSDVPPIADVVSHWHWRDLGRDRAQAQDQVLAQEQTISALQT